MLNEHGKINAFVSASSVTDIYYFLHKRLQRTAALSIIEKILNEFEILPVGKSLLADATQLRGLDFEDNLQIACAVSNKLEGIVTRDQSGFSHSPIAVFSPTQLLAKLAAK